MDINFIIRKNTSYNEYREMVHANLTEDSYNMLMNYYFVEKEMDTIIETDKFEIFLKNNDIFVSKNLIPIQDTLYINDEERLDIQHIVQKYILNLRKEKLNILNKLEK